MQKINEFYRDKKINQNPRLEKEKLNTSKPFCFVNSGYDELYIHQLEVIDLLATMGFPVYVTGKQLHDRITYTEIESWKGKTIPMFFLNEGGVVISTTKPNCFELILSFDGVISYSDFTRYSSIFNMKLWPLVYVLSQIEDDTRCLSWNTFSNLTFKPHKIDIPITHDNRRMFHDGSLPEEDYCYVFPSAQEREFIGLKASLEIDKSSLRPWKTFETEITQILQR